MEREAAHTEIPITRDVPIKNASLPKDQPRGIRHKWLYILGQAVWGMLLSLGLLVLIEQILVIALSNGPTDFCQDYFAASRVSQGIPPYLPVHCWLGSSAVYFPAPVEYDAHPPSSILFFLPFGLLPKEPAMLLWGTLSLVAYLSSGAMLLKLLSWLSLRGMALFVLGSLLWQPAVLAEQVLNFPQVLMLLFLVAGLLKRRGHQIWAGLFLGVASVLKIWPGILLLGTLLVRQKRIALIGGLTCTLMTGLTLFVLGSEAYVTYLGPVRVNEGYWIADQGNISLIGAIARPFIGYHGTPILPVIAPGLTRDGAILLGEGVAGVVLVGMLTLLWWSNRRKQTEATELICYGLLVTTSLIVFPVVQYWNLIVLLLPLASIILVLRQIPRPPHWWFLLLLLSLLPLLMPGRVTYDLPQWLEHQGAHLAGLATLVVSLPTLALLLFAGIQGWLLWRLSTPENRVSSQRQAQSVPLGEKDRFWSMDE